MKSTGASRAWRSKQTWLREQDRDELSSDPDCEWWRMGRNVEWVFDLR